jgi:beta-mannosidase
MQYYILKNTIAVHRSKYPVNMGTLLWQLNDCWPVASWSITDYSRQPKAAWYAVKEAYRDDIIPVKDSLYPKDIKLTEPLFQFVRFKDTISLFSSVQAKFVYLYTDDRTISFLDNYFDLRAAQNKVIRTNRKLTDADTRKIKIRSLYDVISK